MKCDSVLKYPLGINVFGEPRPSSGESKYPDVYRDRGRMVAFDYSR